jgi:oligopeptide transport system substrate-binding protein
MRCRVACAPVLAFFVLGSLFLAGTPVATTAATQDGAGDHVLRIEYNSYPDTLDPQLMYDIDQDIVAGVYFEGLTRIDEELNPAPGAAESWQFSPDAKTLTFHLHDGLVYNDGSPLTAERFRYAIERTCDPRLQSLNASFFFDVVGCEAYFTSLEPGEDGSVPASLDAAQSAALAAARANLGVRALDDRTLEIRFVKPAVYFPALASMAMFYPAKQELIEAGGAEWWRDPANLVSNGPFRVETLGNQTDVPSQMVFIANERYWGGPPALDRIEYFMANEERTGAERLAQYRRGDFDMVWLAWEDFPAVEADPELSRDLVQLPRAATIHMIINANREPFTDKKVREAFAYGFDREGYCQEVQFGFCSPTLSWIPPAIPGAIETDAYAFDPEMARQALAESSYGGPEGLPDVTWYYWEDSSESVREAEWLAGQYRAVLGIELKLEPTTDEEWDRMTESLDTWPQLSTNGWFGSYPDPQYFMTPVWACDATNTSHRLGYCNPELDALLARADGELDAETRIALYEEASAMLLADVPSIMLFNWAEAALVKPYVTDYAVTTFDFWPGWTTMRTIDVDRPEQE